MELSNVDCKHQSLTHADLFFFFKYLVNFFRPEQIIQGRRTRSLWFIASYIARNATSKETFFLLTVYQIFHRRIVVAPALTSHSHRHLQTESVEIRGLRIHLGSFVLMVPQVQN